MMLVARLLLALLLWSANSFGAVTVDTITFVQCNACSSLSFSHTATNAIDGAIAVGVMNFEVSTTVDSLSGATYAGDALTSHCTSETAATVPYYELTWFKRVANAQGVNNVVVSATGVMSSIAAGAFTASGVDQVTPLGSCTNTTDSSATPSATVAAAAGDVIADLGIMSHIGGTLSVGAGQTEQWNTVDAGGFIKIFGSTEPGAASVPVDWTNSIGAPLWIQSAVAIQQAAGGTTLRSRTTTGAGQ